MKYVGTDGRRPGTHRIPCSGGPRVRRNTKRDRANRRRQSNTHTKGACYAAFEPERARELVRRFEFCHTPMHRSWLYVVECELSATTRQDLSGRRMGALSDLRTQITAWPADVNARQRGVAWRLEVDDARRKLKAVYPKIML